MIGRRRMGGERGATLVEAAFVIPVFFLILLGALDFAGWELSRSQASGAARDGARVGILYFQSADTGTGTDYTTKIKNAVTAHLGGTPGSLKVQVNCVQPDGSTVTCASAQPAKDRIAVTVCWSRVPFSIAGRWFGTENISSKSTQVIVGAPDDTAVGSGATQTCP
jgi:Flp pilus assembly protein TadG